MAGYHSQFGDLMINQALHGSGWVGHPHRVSPPEACFDFHLVVCCQFISKSSLEVVGGMRRCNNCFNPIQERYLQSRESTRGGFSMIVDLEHHRFSLSNGSFQSKSVLLICHSWHAKGTHTKELKCGIEKEHCMVFQAISGSQKMIDLLNS